MLNSRWKKSKLHSGDRVRVPESLFITHNSSKFIKAEYMDETSQGIRLRFFFEPGPCSEMTDWWYDTFISWSSIYCGSVKLKTYDGNDVKAERVFA